MIVEPLVFHSDRLQLKIVKSSDVLAIHNLLSIAEVDQYNTLGIPTNAEVTQVYLEEWIESCRMRKEYVFVISLLTTDDFIGLISIKIGTPKYRIGSIWYKLLPDFWSNGYATEATKKILNFGFEECQLHRIEAGCAIGNIGSIKVLEKSGMIREGHKRKVLPLVSGWSDNYEYAMLEEDWVKLK